MLETWFCLTQASSAQLITSFNNVEPLTPAVALSLPWEALTPTRPSPAQTAVGISNGERGSFTIQPPAKAFACSSFSVS